MSDTSWLEDFKEEVLSGNLQNTPEQRKAYRMGYGAAATRASDAANDLARRTDKDD